jgi:hypothetical protein
MENADCLVVTLPNFTIFSNKKPVLRIQIRSFPCHFPGLRADQLHWNIWIYLINFLEQIRPQTLKKITVRRQHHPQLCNGKMPSLVQ